MANWTSFCLSLGEKFQISTGAIFRAFLDCVAVLVVLTTAVRAEGGTGAPIFLQEKEKLRRHLR